MKPIFFLTFFALLFITSCSHHPETLLRKAYSEIKNHESIDYEQIAYYPNPVGKIDTFETSASFRENGKSVTGYDFITRGKFYDNINIEGRFRSVDHRDKNVELFPEDKPDVVRAHITNMNSFRYSPIALLEQSDWKYVKDTLIGSAYLRDFSRVLNDTVIEGNKVYTEEHILINRDSKLLERRERRNYFKGNLSQKVVYTYAGYRFDQADIPLTYTEPLGYKSVFYGRANNRTPLQEGQEAPLFTGNDLENHSYKLEDLRGRKTLLNFSSVGCGYCHQAVQHMNQEDFQPSENIAIFYISPFDKQNDVAEYFEKMDVSYPVIPDAEEIGKMYGVTSTPTFFLIDENGLIERVIIGYDREFLDDLKG